MKLVSLAGVLLCCELLIGCVEMSLNIREPYQADPGHNFTYQIIDNGKAPLEALSILRERVIDQLDAAGLTTQSGSGEPRIVEIVVTKYQMRPSWEKLGVGSIGGTDWISTSIVVKDAISQAVLSRFEAESKYSSSLISPRRLMQKHADKIVNYLKTGKP